ncbi:nicotinate-nucleotide--dimethylbenzimidazole phosphoribosyltransferase [Shewanella litorisediminis]|uniref:Nicotinate-nucleotide--dimethylbenzimidazole phosphoribosyltransferase n=1 Tax=Shewanella litorisediminis TaxID=1173586 RepID=A0ABX7G5I0_9GAMM|nr:nicotinate-nucleotide--dimethylbenzimidazole phosphoribosyltransferase [Shewanella litorisediminis]MCL2917380.1 nicotinate-nucleotide--dimethylbenzimidazole phosphoribosyltransferase [Shewanella litorisediminis]QRH02517.1 nicotinate-nucleotide--dimethylbenzimidazole phosphoribosyltransferase [Shewanella litorisediminis]
MFDIAPVSRERDEQIQARIDDKTKPRGALGALEPLAAHLARLLGESPEIKRPAMLVFAADHGIASAGVSIAPPEVTAQMVANFAAGGAAINVFCRQLGWQLEIIDAGMLSAPPRDMGVTDCRLGAGTGPIYKRAAMTLGQVEHGLNFGRERVRSHHAKGANLIGLGEMGIGNTSSAAAVMAALMGLEAKDCVGRGTGVDAATLKRKQMLVEQALLLHLDMLTSPESILACVGGFEIVEMTGAILGAAELGIPVLVDGFIATVAALAAVKMFPQSREYLIFAHRSAERAHGLMLAHLEAEPLLNLDMRLGEGTGAALALPLVQAAANFYREMASFSDAGITDVTP